MRCQEPETSNCFYVGVRLRFDDCVGGTLDVDSNEDIDRTAAARAAARAHASTKPGTIRREGW
jgi:hypothetical protein